MRLCTFECKLQHNFVSLHPASLVSMQFSPSLRVKSPNARPNSHKPLFDRILLHTNIFLTRTLPVMLRRLPSELPMHDFLIISRVIYLLVCSMPAGEYPPPPGELPLINNFNRIDSHHSIWSQSLLMSKLCPYGESGTLLI